MPNALAPDVRNALLYQSEQGVAPFGIRHGSPTFKGKGYFGVLSNPSGGISTELSAENDGLEYPLLVPTLTKDEVRIVLRGEGIPDQIYEKAYQYALQRQSKGLNPFAQPGELRIPVGFLDYKGR